MRALLSRTQHAIARVSAGDDRSQDPSPSRGDDSDGVKRRRMGSVSLHRGRSTSPSTEDVARERRGLRPGRPE